MAVNRASSCGFMSVRVLFTAAMTTSQCCQAGFPQGPANVCTAISCLLCVCAVSLCAGSPEGPGLARRYPGDRGIAHSSTVIFTDDFEANDLKRWDESRGALKLTGDSPNSGTQCVVSEIV